MAFGDRPPMPPPSHTAGSRPAVPPPTAAPQPSGSGATAPPPPAYSEYAANNPFSNQAAPEKRPGPPPAATASSSGSSDSSLTKSQKQYYQILKNTIVSQNLQSYYKTESQVVDLAKRIDEGLLSSLNANYNLKPRSSRLLVELSLFDLILYVDNSSSMNEGDRIDELEEIAATIADCYLPFDVNGKGLSLYFMNGDKEDDHLGVRTKDAVVDIIEDTLYFGETPFASVLNQKVIGPLMSTIHNNVTSFRPTLVICLTDGSPTERNSATEALIADVKAFLKKHHKPSGVFFQIAQVGNDLAAAAFLNKLDEDETIGDIVDITGSYENEKRQVVAKGGELNKSMWILKLLLGAIDKEFDIIDETR